MIRHGEEKTIVLDKPKLILAEGRDAKEFLKWAYQGFRVDGVQVVDFGGNAELRSSLQLIKNADGYEQVQSVLVARDVESDLGAAIQQVKSALLAAGLPIPTQPCCFADGCPRVAYILFAGQSSDCPQCGTLEDLCLSSVVGDPLLDCVDDYLVCAERKGDVRRPHKAKLHTFLAGKDAYVGAKLGEAAMRKAWDWDHSAFRQLRLIIEQM